MGIEGFSFPTEADFLTNDTALRKALFETYDGRCFYSQTPLDINNFAIDHIVPKSKGGKDNIYNYVPTLPRLNSKKCAKLDETKVGAVLYYVALNAEKVLKLINKYKPVEASSKKSKIIKEKSLVQKVREEKREVMKENRYLKTIEAGEKISEYLFAEFFASEKATILAANYDRESNYYNIYLLMKEEDFRSFLDIYIRKEKCINYVDGSGGARFLVGMIGKGGIVQVSLFMHLFNNAYWSEKFPLPEIWQQIQERIESIHLAYEDGMQRTDIQDFINKD